MSALDRAYRIIQKPVITEKASTDTMNRNAYTFRVPRTANKAEIRDAVQRLFDVKVLSVNTLHVRGKRRVRGRSIGVSQDWKKAIVQLSPESQIDVL
ncbi:MAG TPA: 50S ribosomal protein L23 [Planctomycetes bacterium]|nr:50S ribosomal protein L23 [Planctomycetota bacterium]